MTEGSPARNRVTPWGDIVAAPGRGAWMGNRGRLHEGEGTRDIIRDSRLPAWLTCVLEFRGRRVVQWHPRRYTPLFFLDEAVALAAGHRPCAECRRADFIAFTAAIAAADKAAVAAADKTGGATADKAGEAAAGETGEDGQTSPADPARLRAPELDRRLRPERARDRQGRRLLTPRPWAGLPDGAFVIVDDVPAVVAGDHLTRYDRTANAYGARFARPRAGTAAVLTPPTSLAALQAGYPVQIANEAAR